jgi:hypothetical protein
MDEDFLAQLMASQDTPKKRKRGGLAGIYDRNKKIIKPVVSGALGLVPGIGMGLAAGAGALMSGLDREGKGGIGFDALGGAGCQRRVAGSRRWWSRSLRQGLAWSWRTGSRPACWWLVNCRDSPFNGDGHACRRLVFDGPQCRF